MATNQGNEQRILILGTKAQSRSLAKFVEAVQRGDAHPELFMDIRARGDGGEALASLADNIRKENFE